MTYTVSSGTLNSSIPYQTGNDFVSRAVSVVSSTVSSSLSWKERRKTVAIVLECAALTLSVGP